MQKPAGTAPPDEPKVTEIVQAGEQKQLMKEPKPDAQPKTKKEKRKEKPKDEMPKDEKCGPSDGRKLGEIWWDDEMGRAFFSSRKGVLRSSKPYVPDDDPDAVLVDFENGIQWRPPLIPGDLEKFGELPRAEVPKDPPKPKAKPKAKSASTKPVKDYVLDVIRCKFASQGKASPIIKVEALVDRNNPTSKWHQVVQLVIKDISADYAMNVCRSLADLFQNLNMNPSETNWRECRDALLHYGASGQHDFNKGHLDWRAVETLRFKAFAPSPKLLGLSIWKC